MSTTTSGTGPAPRGPATFPTRDQVRAWLQVAEQTITDEQLDEVIAGEAAAQAALCTVDPWQAPLTLAMYRRCARAVAAMGLPLGMVDPGGEYGGSNLPRYDVEIERYERPFRGVVLA